MITFMWDRKSGYSGSPKMLSDDNGFPCLKPLVQRVGSAPSWPERSAEFDKHCLENLVSIKITY